MKRNAERRALKELHSLQITIEQGVDLVGHKLPLVIQRTSSQHAGHPKGSVQALFVIRSWPNPPVHRDQQFKHEARICQESLPYIR